MAYESAHAYLEERGFADRIMLFETSSATVALAAAAIGCEERQIAKTMALHTPGGVILILMAGDARIDNHKFKYRFSCKAKMLTAEELPELVGHTAGGVCPFGVKPGVRVYLDESLLALDTLYPAAGTAASAVRLHREELEALLPEAEWVDVRVTNPAHV